MPSQIIPSMHEERFCATVATIDDDSFVVIGGHSDVFNGVPLTSCEVYNAVTNTWTLLPRDLPEFRYGCGSATIGRHIYVVGGEIGREMVSTMVAYSLDENKWVSKKPMKQARERVAATAANGRLYVFGGTDGKSPTNEVYDPQTDSWKDLPPMPIERLDCAAVTLDGKIYICGGNDYEGKFLSSLDIFDITTEQWEEGPDMPIPRGGHAVVTVGRNIVVIGGRDEEIDQLASTHFYNVDQMTWCVGPLMTSERSEHVAATISGNKVVIAGGADTEDDFLDTAEAIQFFLCGTAINLLRTMTHHDHNETHSLLSRIEDLEEELGEGFEGSLKERVEYLEEEVFGEFKVGPLLTRLEILEEFIFD